MIGEPLKKAELYGQAQAIQKQVYDQHQQIEESAQLWATAEQSRDSSSALEVKLCRRASEEIPLVDSEPSVTKKETTIEECEQPAPIEDNSEVLAAVWKQ